MVLIDSASEDDEKTQLWMQNHHFKNDAWTKLYVDALFQSMSQGRKICLGERAIGIMSCSSDTSNSAGCMMTALSGWSPIFRVS
jgi:hypothetical protein